MYTSNDPKVIGRSYINQAIGAYNSGDNYGAQVYLARAIISDPDLKNDPEVRTLASKYTGLDVDAALKRLTTPARNSRGNNDDASDEGKSGDQWFVVLLELILLLVTAIFAFVIIQSSARQFAAEIADQLGSSSSQLTSQGELQRLLSYNEPGLVLRAALSFGFSTIIGIVLWNIIMYAFCIAALGGAGGLLSHMSVVFRVQIVFLLVYAALFFVMVLSFRAPLATRSNLLQIISGLLLLNSLGTGIALIYYISKVHQFDVVKGFVAVVLSPFIIGCGLCGLLYVARLIR